MSNTIRENTHYIIYDDWRGKETACEWFYYTPATNAVRVAKFVGDKITISVYTFKRCHLPLAKASQIALWFKTKFIEGVSSNENEPLHYPFSSDNSDTELR